MNHHSAHTSKWKIADVIFGVPFLIGAALQWFFPLSLPLGIALQALPPMGFALTLSGIIFISLGRREFARYRQPTDPGHPTSKVITSGIFSITRNPLYLGSVMVFLGITLIWNMLWTLVMLILSIILCHYLLIIPEEQYLSAKLGKEYEEYTASVHRWLGRK